MKLFLIEQSENTGYDTYDSAVVVAESDEVARDIDPSRDGELIKWDRDYSLCWDWCEHPENVKVTYLGEAVSKKTQRHLLRHILRGDYMAPKTQRHNKIYIGKKCAPVVW